MLAVYNVLPHCSSKTNNDEYLAVVVFLLSLRVATNIILMNLLLYMCFSHAIDCFRKGGQGIFNVRNNLSACYVHESHTGIDKYAQMLIRKTEKRSLTLSQQGVEP